ERSLAATRAPPPDDRPLMAAREVQEAADLRLGIHLAGALLEAPDQRHRRKPLARDGGLGALVLGHLAGGYRGGRAANSGRRSGPCDRLSVRPRPWVRARARGSPSCSPG